MRLDESNDSAKMTAAGLARGNRTDMKGSRTSRGVVWAGCRSGAAGLLDDSDCSCRRST